MHIHNLSENNSVLNHFLAQIRDVNIQKDNMRFRKNIERIGEIMAFEISKTLEYIPMEITTPLSTKSTSLIKNGIVVCSILRAGLTLHNGLLNFFDAAESGFISAYRYHPNNDDYFIIQTKYQAVPDLNGKTLILADPMLATGLSLEAVFKNLMVNQTPKEIHIAVVIAAPEGIEHLKTTLPDNCHLWIADTDERLNEHKYIVPGLGDAGDLAYGNRL
ncbi:uracil phosphoribosyltransferase [Flavobacterium beibuense]|uniref:Uracil phosphoribosyltransferase n=1 Tax=Flavobacterium beibuense TaxID=657326 RepID=A0A444WDN6_9FLAO|nr:uracil phosphoribosyltransferase [Flavobacterium beibuense]RYJ43905.1 Uracil phosphoribosyltransferase [Flavobacterium beibuense]